MRMTLKALLACVLALLPVGLARATINQLESAGNTITVAAGSLSSVSSGDVVLACSGAVNVAAADARLSNPDGTVFTIGQLQLTIRYLNAEHTVLGAINLPTAPTVGDISLFASSLFYAASLTTPMTFATTDKAGTSQILIRATAIVQNTTAAAHAAALQLNVLFSGFDC